MKTIKPTILAIMYLIICNIAMAQTHYIKSSNGLNLRSGPGANESILTSIPVAGEVEVIDKGEEWSQVEYKGKKGYVSSKFLTEDKKEAEAAAKSSKKKSSKNHASASSKNSGSGSQGLSGNWGLGLRLGDPSGISAKKYMNDGKALELSIGRTAFWGVDNRYRDRFDDLDDFNYEFSDFQGSRIKSAIAIQVHYLFHDDLNIEGVSGLQWYYGFGGQIRFITVAYNFRYGHDHDPDPDDWDNHWHSGGEESRTDFDVGADGVIGVEYTLKNPKFSIFLDITLFMELLDNPFLFNGQSGIGARYNFQ